MLGYQGGGLDRLSLYHLQEKHEKKQLDTPQLRQALKAASAAAAMNGGASNSLATPANMLQECFMHSSLVLFFARQLLYF